FGAFLVGIALGRFLVIGFGGIVGIGGVVEISGLVGLLIEVLNILIFGEFVINDVVSHSFLQGSQRGRSDCSSGIAAGGYYARRSPAKHLRRRNMPHRDR